MNDIEKCARLMGLDYEVIGNDIFVPETIPDLPAHRIFNPLTNAQDREDLMCSISNIGVSMNYSLVIVDSDKEDGKGGTFGAVEDYKNHPTKQAALAHAVVSVAVQIYDSKFGDGK